MKESALRESPYIVQQANIVHTWKMTPLERFFEISLSGMESLNHDPGQFVMVSVPGVGEVPISVASSPTKRSSFELVIRNAGKVTGAIHDMEAGETIGIRGPFGTGFPTQVLEGNALLFVAGGLGIVPLRSLINFVMDNRRDFGKVDILLGSRSPKDMLFGNEVEIWNKRFDVNFVCTIDRSDPDWKGNVGLITSLIPGVTIHPERTFAVVVGPPIMYRFVIVELLKKRIPENQILVSLERHMKCGVGKCGHCQIGEYYCCQQGPVFPYHKIKNRHEAK